MKGHRLIVAMIVGVGLLASVMVLPVIAQNGLREGLPGSLLIFPKFDVSSSAATQIRISDVSDTTSAIVHVNVICPPDPFQTSQFHEFAGTCTVNDRFYSLTPHGTKTFNVATEFPGLPCQQGYLMAFAVNGAGTPIVNNNLIGSYRITGGTGIHTPELDEVFPAVVDGDDTEANNAVAVQSLQEPDGKPLGKTDILTGELLLHFGLLRTSDYIALPFRLFSDFQAVTPTNQLSLILLTPSIRANVVNPSAFVSGRFWNEVEREHSFGRDFVCWQEIPLGFAFNNTAGFTAANLGSATGSMQIDALKSQCLFPIGDCGPSVAGGPNIYSPAILGVVREDRPGPSHRFMYHIGLRSTDFAPSLNRPPAP
jgi:hypothetical protein